VSESARVRKSFASPEAATAMHADPGHRAHGTLNGYGYWKCRCRRCRQARAGYEKEHGRAPKEKRLATIATFHADPTDPKHGTTNGYGNLGCRCARCCEANTKMHAEYMARRNA
jgi:hypothetical protein